MYNVFTYVMTIMYMGDIFLNTFCYLIFFNSIPNNSIYMYNVFTYIYVITIMYMGFVPEINLFVNVLALLLF